MIISSIKELTSSYSQSSRCTVSRSYTVNRKTRVSSCITLRCIEYGQRWYSFSTATVFVSVCWECNLFYVATNISLPVNWVNSECRGNKALQGHWDTKSDRVWRLLYRNSWYIFKRNKMYDMLKGNPIGK